MKTIKTIFSLALLIGMSYQITAQTCPTILKEKNGTVYSVNPAIFKETGTSDQTSITIRKTDGRAKTEVYFFVDGVQQGGKMTFSSGQGTRTKSRTVNNTKNKEVKVKIYNRSVSNTFKYNAKIYGEKRSISEAGGPSKGLLIGQQKKTIKTIDPCTPRTKVIIRRRNGVARATVRVYRHNYGASWSLMPAHSYLLEQGDNSKIFTVETDKKIKVELQNISMGNTFSYTMNALAQN